jgi:MinD superfamily P-loop ATPase
MSAQPSLEQAVSDVFANCTECRACQKFCPFLAKFGLPKELLGNPSEVLFFCTNCTACSKICPERLPVAQSLYEAKTQLLRKDFSTRAPYISAKSYAERDIVSPFLIGKERRLSFGLAVVWLAQPQTWFLKLEIAFQSY